MHLIIPPTFSSTCAPPSPPATEQFGGNVIVARILYRFIIPCLSLFQLLASSPFHSLVVVELPVCVAFPCKQWTIYLL